MRAHKRSSSSYFCSCLSFFTLILVLKQITQHGSGAAEAAAALVELAMARGSNDNISVIVVELKKSRKIYY
jgi:serine/threonine protein phosphatase PrpC